MGLMTILSFLVAVIVIVFVHEYGHYLAARLCGVKVHVFSVGLGPPITLWRRRDGSRVRLVTHDRHGTRWQVALIPLGGFVSIDESALFRFRTGSSGNPPGEQSFPPLRHSAFIVAAGPAASLVFGAFVLAAGLFASGIPQSEPVAGGIRNLPSELAGIERGDRILAVDGNEVESLSDLYGLAQSMTPLPAHTYEILRNDEQLTVQGPFPMPAIAVDVLPGQPADIAGLRAGDLILSTDGKAINSFQELQEVVRTSEGREIRLVLWRAGELLEVAMRGRLQPGTLADGTQGQITTVGVIAALLIDPEYVRPTPFEAIGLGISQSSFIVITTLEAIGGIITGSIDHCNLQGPVGIAKMAGHAAASGIDTFIFFLGLLSIAIGVFNLLPIPILDGGRLLFFGFEALTGLTPNQAIANGLNMVGVVLLTCLLAFALWTDAVCL